MPSIRGKYEVGMNRTRKMTAVAGYLMDSGDLYCDGPD